MAHATHVYHCLLLPWQQWVAKTEKRISRLIAKEHPPRLVDYANDVVPFHIISFVRKKVPTAQAYKEATEFVQSGNGWAKTAITITCNKKTENASFKCALPNRKDRILQTSCYLNSCMPTELFTGVFEHFTLILSYSYHANFARGHVALVAPM